MLFFSGFCSFVLGFGLALFLCVYLLLDVPRIHSGPLGGPEDDVLTGAGVTVTCESSSVDARSQTQDLCWSSKGALPQHCSIPSS